MEALAAPELPTTPPPLSHARGSPQHAVGFDVWISYPWAFAAMGNNMTLPTSVLVWITSKVL